jgi:hypothetical protein
MPYKSFDSIFTEVGNASKKADKIRILHENSSPAMKTILGMTYDPNVVWLLPEGTPPYTSLSEHADGGVTLQGLMRQLYLFVEGPTDTQKNLKQTRREQIFIEMLESLPPEECKVLIGMKERKLPYKGVTRKLVAEAFPNLAKTWF